MAPAKLTLGSGKSLRPRCLSIGVTSCSFSNLTKPSSFVPSSLGGSSFHTSKVGWRAANLRDFFATKGTKTTNDFLSNLNRRKHGTQAPWLEEKQSSNTSHGFVKMQPVIVNRVGHNLFSHCAAAMFGHVHGLADSVAVSDFP